MGATLGKIAKEILVEILQNWLGSFLPDWNFAAPSWLFVGVFCLLMIPLVWGRISAFREQRRDAVVAGRARQHLWVNATFVLLLIALGLWLSLTQR